MYSTKENQKHLYCQFLKNENTFDFITCSERNLTMPFNEIQGNKQRDFRMIVMYYLIT